MIVVWTGIKLLEPAVGPPTPDPMFKARTGEIEAFNIDEVLRIAKAGEFDVPKGLVVRSANIGPDGLVLYFRDAPKSSKKERPKPRRRAIRG